MAKRGNKRFYPKRPFAVYKVDGNKETRLPRRLYSTIERATEAARRVAWQMMEGVSVVVHNEHSGRDLVQFRRQTTGVTLWTWSSAKMEKLGQGRSW